MGYLQNKMAKKKKTLIPKGKHIDDVTCSECKRYICSFIVTNGSPTHSCPCDCHKVNSKEARHNG